MAPRQSPHPASSLPESPAGPTPTSTTVPPPLTRVTHRDIDQAKEDALLQLRIGRTSHSYAVIVSGALLIDALLVLFFPPNLSSTAPRDLPSLYFLIFPLFGGLAIAAFGLQVKWEEYQLWPWEAHFSVSVAAVGVDALLIGVYLADLTGALHWSLLPGFYALTLVGIMLPLLGLALTWADWSPRKIVDVAAAIAPVPIAFALYLPTLGGSSQIDALVISLSSSAVLFQMSGSFLHLIASGTRSHEREVIRSGQDRLFQVAAELRQREEALRFRESTILRREADVDNAETSLRRKVEALEQSHRHADEIEADAEKRASAVTALQRELAVATAETNARGRFLEDKDAAMRLREQDLAQRLPKLSDREKELLEREGAVAAQSAEVDARTAELTTRTGELADLEHRLDRRENEIEEKTTALLLREAEAARSTPVLPPPPVPIPPSVPSPEELAGLSRRAAELDQRAAELEVRSTAMKSTLAQAEQNRRESARLVEALRARESEVARREREAADRVALSESRIRQYDEAVRTYEEKTQVAETKAAELDQRAAEVTRHDQALEQRAAALDSREAETLGQRRELDALEQRLEGQATRLSSLENELRYREQALARRSEPEPGELSIAFAAAGEQDLPPSPRPSRALPPPFAEPVDDVLEPEPAPRTAGPAPKFPDRIPTGTPRLDDLLLGGFPPRGHVMFIGDAFVEKEVGVYGYLAEGLKRGEPVIVLTAARGPEELSQRIGLVTPQFHEYEQLGMVRWIDASVPEGAEGERASTDTRSTTDGPQDLAGILSALVRALNAYSGEADRPVRVAYFGLSATLAHLDERQRVQFIQNIVGVLKARNALAVYTLESGTLPDTQMETILSRLDGAIYFKRDRDKLYLCVQGLGEVQTHQWVEYRATNRALLIGSFSLERIR